MRASEAPKGTDERCPLATTSSCPRRPQWRSQHSPAQSNPVGMLALPLQISNRYLGTYFGVEWRARGRTRVAGRSASTLTGHDMRALQHYLGHKNIQHTVRYTDMAPDRAPSPTRKLSRPQTQAAGGSRRARRSRRSRRSLERDCLRDRRRSRPTYASGLDQRPKCGLKSG